jgi:hypothetical protein
VGQDVEIGGRLTLETTGGGVLDSFVNRYHELLGFGKANRDRFPADGYRQWRSAKAWGASSTR